jgi:PAS domain S-box-containing protein
MGSTPQNPSLASASPGPDGLRSLLNASAMLLGGGTVSEILSGILDLATQVIAADAYAFWQTHDEGATWCRTESRGLSASYPVEFAAPTPQLPAEVSFHHSATDETNSTATIPARLDEGIRSMLVVPIPVEGRNTATITFYWRAPRSFDQADIDYAMALANISATALNLSRLHEQNKREKQRLTFLAEASTVLASSLEYEKTLERVANLAVPHIADWCSVYMVEDGVIGRLETAHADPAWRARAKEYTARYPERIRPDRGIGKVLRTGTTEIVPILTDAMFAASDLSEDQMKEIRAFGITSIITVPLVSRDTVLGAIMFIAAGGNRHFTGDDVQLAEDLARRAAASIENAKLHRALVERQKALRLAHSAARMGSWSFDLVNHTIFWSDEFKALHGLPLDAVSGREAGIAHIHPEDRVRVLAELDAALASTSDQIVTENRALMADGRVFWLHSRGRIERDAEGKAIAIAGISMDVTERRLAEDALRRTEKLAAAGRLAATVAHEVNNPLESIINLVYISKQTPGIPGEVAEHLAAAESELNRLAQIVRQTLGFYREPTLAAPTDIGTITLEILDLYRARILSRSLHLSSEITPGLTADVIAGEIKQVVANLISNAIDATPAGGAIHVTVRPGDNRVEILIADTGTGIEESNLPHLFEPFFTTKAEIGTGLGLWVSKGIVEKHHGSIAVESSMANRGTTFTVGLPLAV